MSAVAPLKKGGRPPGKTFSPEEVADLLAVPPERVVRALEFHPRSFFPGAWKGSEGWIIPEREVKALLGPSLPRFVKVKTFAELLDFSLAWVYELIKTGIISKRDMLGEMRISLDEIWKIPAERPWELPNDRRASFFAERKEGSEV